MSDSQFWGQGIQLLLVAYCWASLPPVTSHDLRESLSHDLRGRLDLPPAQVHLSSSGGPRRYLASCSKGAYVMAQSQSVQPPCLDWLEHRPGYVYCLRGGRQATTSAVLVAVSSPSQVCLQTGCGAPYWKAPVALGPFCLSASHSGPALQHSGQLVMAALTPEQWSNLRPLLNADLLVTGSIGHPSVPVGSTLVRLARLPVSELAHIPTWLPESRRIWVQVSHRHTSSVLITDEVCQVLSLWRDFLHQSTCRQSILLAPLFQCEAFADACADSTSVGFGGYVKFPSGITRFFQLSISKSALVLLCP